MIETANGGLLGAAAKPVGTIDDVAVSPWDKRIADIIESDDDTDLTGSIPIASPASQAPEDKQDGGELAAVGTPDASPRSWGFDVAEINRSYALALWGGKAVVINEQPNGPVNDRVRIMSFESMNSWFANRHTEIIGADGKIKSVSWAKAWHSHRDRRQYDGIEFFPNPDGAPGTPNYLNFWRGFDVEPLRDGGTYERFRDHLFINVCASDPKLFNYVFGWMAHLVQKPRERLGVALVLRGKRGTGKSKVGEVIGSLFSSHYFQVDDARYVTGQFNSHMASCLLLQSDEAVWAGDKGGEGRLKGLITSDTQMIESKGIDPIRLRNFLRVIMTSNEGWVVPAGLDERRFCILDVGDASMQNREYFAEMDDQLDKGGRARLLYDLLNFDLKKVDLWHVPQTQALLEQKVRSLDTIDDFWFNRLMEGDDWPGRVVCADLYEEYIKASARIGVGRKRGPAEFASRLLKLAPAIRKSRPAIEIAPGITKRVWCYDMPSLDDCRSMFEELLGQPIQWPALSSGEGERAEYSPSDEAISV